MEALTLSVICGVSQCELKVFAILIFLQTSYGDWFVEDVQIVSVDRVR